MAAGHLAPNPAQLRPIAPGAHATAIYDKSGIGELGIRDKCFPVALNLVLTESHSDRLQQCAIVHLRFTSDIERSGKPCPQGSFQFTEFRTFDVFEVPLRVARSKHLLDANCLSGIFAVPEQQTSIVPIKHRHWQLSQPLRPQRNAEPPHGFNLWARVDSFGGWCDHPGRRPGSGAFPLAASSIVKGDSGAGLRGPPGQATAQQAAPYDGDVLPRHW